MTDRTTNWHRLYGLTIDDLLTHTPYEVELEADMTVKQQFLDVVIIRQNDAAPFDCSKLPNGFDNLKAHNLQTYKSFREPLDDFAIEELVGHFINYQKIKGLRLSTDEVQLYAVTTRYPEKLFSARAPAANPSDGVYDAEWGRHLIRVIVLKQLAATPQNAALNMFSANYEKVRYGAGHYTWNKPQATVMQRLYRFYSLEEFIEMPYTYEQFEREFKQEMFQEFKEDFLQQYTADERLAGLAAEERLRGLAAEERLRGLAAKEVFSSLSEEQLQELTEEQRVLLDKLLQKNHKV